MTTATAPAFATSVHAIEKALAAVAKVARFSFDIEVVKACPDDCGRIAIVFGAVDGRNVSYISTAMAMLADNSKLSDRVRDTWLDICEREDGDTQFARFGCWVQA